MLIHLGLKAAASAVDAKNNKKIIGSGTHDLKTFGTGSTTLIILKEEKQYIMKTIKSLDDSGVLIKGIDKAIENETKNKGVAFLEFY